MSKPFKELRDKMSPERRERVEQETQRLLKEIEDLEAQEIEQGPAEE